MKKKQPKKYQKELVLEEIPLFLTSCFTVLVNQFDNKDLAKRIVELSKKDPGRHHSNRGGWQSDDVIKSKLDNKIPDLGRLLEFSEHLVKPIFDRNDLLYRGKPSAWINVNNYRDFNLSHDHPFTALSLVYFISCPRDSGCLVFERPDSLERFAVLRDEALTPNSFTHFKIQPVEGMFVVFPGYLRHEVEFNRSHEPRISFTMNFS